MLFIVTCADLSWWTRDLRCWPCNDQQCASYESDRGSVLHVIPNFIPHFIYIFQNLKQILEQESTADTGASSSVQLCNGALRS